MNKKEIVCYNEDASRIVGSAERVVFPRSIGEVQQIVNSLKLDLVPRGAGTGLVGGCHCNNSVVVDMSRMDKIRHFNPVKKTVYAEAGVTLKELNEKLNAVGFEFPIDLNNRGISTIGGMIATNASGNRSMRYGSMKEWVEEAEFVNGRGEVMKTGKTDLGDVCGMEGITGIIVGALLKIIPKARRSASVFQSEDLEEVLSIARRLKMESEVIMLELFSREVSKILGLSEKYHIFVEFSSDRGKIKDEEYEQFLNLKDNVYFKLYSEGYYNSEDPKLFFDKLNDFILFLEANQIVYIGFLGSGFIHPFFRDGENEKRDSVVDYIKRSQAKFGKYGFGIKRKDLLDNFEKKIIQRVKLRHDPFNKFNRGKILDLDVSREKRDFRIRDEGTVKTGTLRIVAGEGERKSASEFLEELKTPEEKIGEFIRIEEEKESGTSTEKSDREEIKNRIEDYRQTFDSELEEEKRRKVEELARAVQKSVSSPKPRDTSYSDIRDIMTNKYGFKDYKKPVENNSRDEANGKKSEAEEDERDLINRIMLNKLDKDKEKR
jgi:FAD/FMN-containing dehydrogenase